jgi:hypothetical protein
MIIGTCKEKIFLGITPDYAASIFFLYTTVPDTMIKKTLFHGGSAGEQKSNLEKKGIFDTIATGVTNFRRVNNEE